MEENEFNNSEQETGNPSENSAELHGEEQSSTASAPPVAEESVPDDEQDNGGKTEEANSISSDLIRGHINTIILRALYERDKYGYEIMSDIEQKSHGQYSLKQPTLYSALKRLENQGYIKAYWKTDEVTSGGRRKYFTLTESGKEITEKNLAEWEYSRTIIDSLISDRSFDFSNPAPTPVDFHILKNSVSRVPIVRSDETDRTVQDGEVVSSEKPADEVKTDLQEKPADEKPAEQPTYESMIAQPETLVQTQQDAYTIRDDSQVAQPVQQQQEQVQPLQEQPIAEAQTQNEQPAAPTAQEEARRIAHENYLRLISEPVRVETPAHQEDIVPNSVNVNTEGLLYNNRPETERDYKNLIDGIFSRAVANGRVQTTYKRELPPPAPAPEPARKVRLVDRGRADGVTVTTSSSFDSESTYATKTTYNKGLTMLKCSAIVLAIIVIESIFCFIFQSQLAVNWIYPTILLLIGLIQFSVFGVMTLQGYGKNCVRPTTNGYISSCVILTVIAILIISALSFLLNVNPNLVSDVMKMIVIPSITALNITVFAVCFKLFIK